MESAYTNKNHRETIQLASAGADQVHQPQLLAVLNYRAFDFGMNSQFTQTVKYTQEIVTLKPALATGYLRLGLLYHVQGKQKGAMETYSLGASECISRRSGVRTTRMWKKRSDRTKRQTC